MLQCGKPFPRVMQRYTTLFTNFTGLYFPHFTIFSNQTLQTKLRMLFPTVLIIFHFKSLSNMTNREMVNQYCKKTITAS